MGTAIYTENGWAEHKKLVEAELARGAVERKEIIEKITTLSTDVAVACENRQALREDTNQNTSDIKELRRDLTTVITLVGQLATELKIKAGFWGALGASIPSAIAVIFILVSK